MMRGLWKLTWLEIKIFLREPLGAFGSILVPLAVFALAGRFAGGRPAPRPPSGAGFLSVGLPVLVAVFIALNAVLSLATIVSIYREGGILKRLRATPLRPHTILAAHVLVKLALTTVSLALTLIAGQRFYPLDGRFPVFGFTIALLISSWSILSIGFLIASVVPTARFAQPIGGAVLYPMLALCGVFAPVHSLPPPGCTQSRARCPSPMRYRFWRESEKAKRGRRTWATSARWSWYSLSAHVSRQWCFAGNSASLRISGRSCGAARMHRVLRATRTFVLIVGAVVVAIDMYRLIRAKSDDGAPSPGAATGGLPPSVLI